ncbi:hypothetical protein NKR23_g12303 [Pleurostoma richardsiae]|uniref:Protein kinase domain-containing protein n=1 Tax=Pleurostoma richardsiae TaxID=41990 RepID=A0AA38R2D5_9PEZI|nr:hypothetical protein NKR23_g12303 [Pleurostoma richardsiae]
MDVVLIDFAGSSLDGSPPSMVAESRFYRPRRRWKDAMTVQDDLFALGSTLYELFKGEMPYPNRTDDEVAQLYHVGSFPAVHQIPIGRIIAKCWSGGYGNATDVLDDFRLQDGPQPVALAGSTDSVFGGLGLVVSLYHALGSWFRVAASIIRNLRSW